MKKLLKAAVPFILAFFLAISALAAVQECDTNADGDINLGDALTVLQEISKAEPSCAADANGDGFVSLLDAMAIFKYLISGIAPSGNYYSYTDIVERMLDTRYLSMGNTGEVSKLFSSYDRRSTYAGGVYSNWRANGDGANVLGTTADGGQLIADIEGSGFISRIWSATSGPGHVKVFIDGAEEATVDLAFTDYFSGTAEPFVYENLVYEDSALGKNNYVPITFRESCRVVAYGGFGEDGWGKYYHINYTLFPEGTKVESMPSALTGEQIAALEKVNAFFGENLGKSPDGYEDAPFETYTVTKASPAVKTLSGKGAVSGLLVRVDSLAGAYENSYEAVETLKNLRIKIWWDGESEPSVNAPLGDFFASGFGFTDVRTLLVGVRDDRTLYNYYYMPYLEDAKIEIYTVDDGTHTVSLSVNTVENTVNTDDMLYFGAQFNLGNYHPDALVNGEYNTSAERSPDYHFLTVKGAGKLVGVNLHLNKTINGKDPLSSPGSPWWGEGDEKFFIDGEAFPSWYGTGTEDFFGYAWCSPNLFTKAYHAQSYCEGGSNSIGNRTLTRLLVGDSIPFNESFEGYIEKYYTDEYVKYGFTSYFYLAKDSTVENVNYDSTAPLGYYEPSSEGKYLIEGEDMYIQGINSASGAITHQAMLTYSPAWSKGTQLLVSGLAKGDSIDLALPAPRSGEYVLLASFANAKDFAILQASVNGADVGEPVDCYASVVAADYLSEIGKVTLAAGYANTLTLTAADKNSSATKYNFGLDFVLLVPADEYTGIAELDLGAYTDVIRLNTKRDIPADTSSYTFEGEGSLAEFAAASKGTLRAQSMSAWSDSWSGDAQLWWYGGTEGSTLTVYAFVEEAGTYGLVLGYTAAEDYGIYTIKVNGKNIGTIDGYNNGVVCKSAEFGSVALKAGYNKIVFSIIGKNASATSYMAGIDCIKVAK